MTNPGQQSALPAKPDRPPNPIHEGGGSDIEGLVLAAAYAFFVAMTAIVIILGKMQ